MKSLVITHPIRVEVNCLEVRVIKALLSLGAEVMVWCWGVIPSLQHHTQTIRGAKPLVAKEFPWHYNPDIVFIGGAGSTEIPLTTKWLSKPIVFLKADRYKESWSPHYELQWNMAKLAERGFPIFFWAASQGGREELQEHIPAEMITMLEGKVPDEVFLFPEHDVLVSPRRDMVIWVGNDINRRTYLEVFNEITNAFPDIFLVICSNQEPNINFNRRVIFYRNIPHIFALRLVLQSKATIAPYRGDVPHIPFGNPIKYWESIALNTPFVVTDNYVSGGKLGAWCKMCGSSESAVEFTLKSLSEILSKDALQLFPSPDALHKWRKDNWFTLQVARALWGVSKTCNLQIPLQLSQFLDTMSS